MADRTYLEWPFLDDTHRAMAAEVAAWRDRELSESHDSDPSAACRAYVTQLGAAGWLKYAVRAWLVLAPLAVAYVLVRYRGQFP